MGITIPVRKFFADNTSSVMKPIIYCCSNVNFAEYVFSMNVPLAKKLLEYNPKRRTMKMEQCFIEILNQLPDCVVIKDFDVMFNPDYKIDVLQIMTNVCKRKPFSIIWPGKYEAGKLYYAEHGFPDYKVFSVDDYDVICVIEGGTKDEIF